MLTVKEVAKKLQVADRAVLGWIRRGEISAVDVSRFRGEKPRWRISEEALQAFLRDRQIHPAVRRQRKRRNERTNVVEFF